MPDTDADYDDPDDEPVPIRGEPLSETVIRDAADGGLFFRTSALVKRQVTEAGSPWVKSLVHAKAGHTLYIARITAVEMFPRSPGGSIAATFPLHGQEQSSGISAAIWSIAIALSSSPLSFSTRRCSPPASVGSELMTLSNWRSFLMSTGSKRQPGFWAVTLVSADQASNDAATAEGLMVEDPNHHP